jgi:hypothetical protein
VVVLPPPAADIGVLGPDKRDFRKLTTTGHPDELHSRVIMKGREKYAFPQNCNHFEIQRLSADVHSVPQRASAGPK